MQSARGPREDVLVMTGRAGKVNRHRPEWQNAGKQYKEGFGQRRHMFQASRQENIVNSTKARFMVWLEHDLSNILNPVMVHVSQGFASVRVNYCQVPSRSLSSYKPLKTCRIPT